MKIIINGELNRSSAQNLCLIFFPGEKFGENEEVTPDTPVVTFTLKEKDGFARARVHIKAPEGESEAFQKEPVDHWYSASKAMHIAAGGAILKAGTKLFKSTPAWGLLTGVRPAKVVMPLLEGGMPRDGVISVLTDDYRVTPKKASLVTDVAAHEMAIIENYGQNCCSLYVSIPFCPTRCAYCSFVSYSTKRLLSLIPEYIERLCSDLDRMAAQIRRSGKRLVTIYIGGGTPSILTEQQLRVLLDRIAKNFDVPSLLEYTIEAGRPDTITEEKLKVCLDHGVTRVSINPQTLNDDVLQAIGRKHTVEDFYRAFDMAKRSGIPHINTDLIAGLPGDNFRSFSDTVDKITDLAPDNVTVHTFCVKKSADIVSSGARIYSRTGGDTGKCVDYSQLRAKECGYAPYYIYRQKNSIGSFENVGFAKPGTEGLYNMLIMEEIHTIYAVGAGAVTKLVDRENGRIERVFMPKYPYEYLSMGQDSPQLAAAFGRMEEFEREAEEKK